MNLPGHFLADLPSDAALTPPMIAEACRALRRNRERSLARFSTAQMAGIIAETARRWLQPDDPFRQLALAEGPVATGFSAATLGHGLDAFFGEWTLDNMEALLVQDLGSAGRLDQFGPGPGEVRPRQTALATAPELLVQFTAGNLPVSGMTSLLLGVLLRSAQFLKCASGATLFPRLLAHSLVDTEPGLAGGIEIAGWPGGTTILEEPLLAEADLVTASGSDATLADLSSRLALLPRRPRLVGYGHQVSFGYITRDALGGFERARTVAQAAEDVAAWDQCGCLSPQVFYVEGGGPLAAEAFAELLSLELARREETHPRGTLSLEASTGITLKRDFYAIRAAAGAETETRLWQSPESTAWTVVYESSPLFQAAGQHRFIHVKPVADLAEALRGADAVRGRVSTVGIAGAGHRGAELAAQLARWGVTRVCPLGRMQRPPLTWRHDGRPALGDLITWTGLES
jgi:hypothetical protein